MPSILRPTLATRSSSSSRAMSVTGPEPHAVTDLDRMLVVTGKMLAERQVRIAFTHRQRVERRDVAELDR